MVVFKLKTFLATHDLTVYGLAREMGKPDSNVYRLVRSDTPRQFAADTLSEVIQALRTLTGKPVAVSDLLEYQEAPQAREVPLLGQEPATGALGPVATHARDQSAREGVAGTAPENGAPATDQLLTAAGVPYTGDEETDEILNAHPDILERTAAFERGEAGFIPLDELRAKYGHTAKR